MKRIDDYLENFYTGVNSEEVYELKNEIMLTFMRTQNLIISSYFDNEFKQ